MLHYDKHPLGRYLEREGINRAELARRLQVNSSTITRLFERGRRPDPEVGARIRDLLGLATLDEVYAAFGAGRRGPRVRSHQGRSVTCTPHNGSGALAYAPRTATGESARED